MKYFIEALKKYVVFSGRARRAEYWFFQLFSNLVIYLAIFYQWLTEGTLQNGQSKYVTIIQLFFSIPHFAVAIRRMHDVNRSGWYFLIPIYGFILSVTEGDRGENRYGTDPIIMEETYGGY